jgi:hypothetical protein
VDGKEHGARKRAEDAGREGDTPGWFLTQAPAPEPPRSDCTKLHHASQKTGTRSAASGCGLRLQGPVRNLTDGVARRWVYYRRPMPIEDVPAPS